MQFAPSLHCLTHILLCSCVCCVFAKMVTVGSNLRNCIHRKIPESCRCIPNYSSDLATRFPKASQIETRWLPNWNNLIKAILCSSLCQIFVKEFIGHHHPFLYLRHLHSQTLLQVSSAMVQFISSCACVLFVYLV